MDDTTKVTILKHAGLAFIPQEPVALVAMLLDVERRTLVSERIVNAPGTRHSKLI
jgi:hypothetical protein